jgi:hypothetical protein
MHQLFVDIDYLTFTAFLFKHPIIMLTALGLLGLFCGYVGTEIGIWLAPKIYRVSQEIGWLRHQWRKSDE